MIRVRCLSWVLVRLARWAVAWAAVGAVCQFSAAGGAEPNATRRNSLPGIADPAWDRLFTRTEGWTGGDVAGTVDLGSSRTLWLFGDTWLGTVAQRRHVPGAQMVNNSIAIQEHSAGGSNVPPASGSIHFHAGNDEQGHPAAWIVPQAVPVEGKSEQSVAGPMGWYWPTGGGVVVPGPSGGPRLLVFLFHVGKRAGKEGVWAFKHLGCTMAEIENFREPVEKWQVQQFDIPFAVGADRVEADHTLRETSWGVAAYWEPAGAAAPGALYVYGTTDQSPLNRQLLLARVPGGAAHEFDRWQFYAGGGKWSSRAADAVAVAENLVSELSVEESPAEGRRTFVMVHSEPIFGRHVLVRTAGRPEGPWSKPLPVYSVPEVDRNRTYFTYAAKGHLHLSPPGELLITYLVNAHDFATMANDASIYRPRFIRVPLGEILREP